MIVQHNMASFNANRILGNTDKQLQVSTEKLSSGYRINRAADDAAGLSISEKMRGQIRGLNAASTNAQTGQSLIQVADGALAEVHSIIQRMRELTVQASNDTNVSSDRKAIAYELAALSSEIDRIASQTEFNTIRLLDGKFQSKWLQVGANRDQSIKFSIKSMSAMGLKITVSSIAANVGNLGGKWENTDISGSTITKLIKTIDNALSEVSIQRSKLGALQNRLDHVIANADNMSENLTASESKIRDTDMAKEMVQYSAKSILQQAGQSMLSQANQATQGVLSLIR